MRGQKWGPILVGTDGSEGAARAIDAAGALVAELDTDLWIVNVSDGTSDSVVTQFARAEEASMGDTAEAVGRHILEEAKKRAQAGGARKLHTVWRAGDCAEEIVAATTAASIRMTVRSV